MNTMVDHVAASLWPWVRVSLYITIPWEDVHPGSLEHDITIDASLAAIAAMCTHRAKHPKIIR